MTVHDTSTRLPTSTPEVFLGVMLTTSDGVFVWEATFEIPVSSNTRHFGAEIEVVGRTGEDKTVLDMALSRATREFFELNGTISGDLTPDDEAAFALDLIKLHWDVVFEDLLGQMTDRALSAD